MENGKERFKYKDIDKDILESINSLKYKGFRLEVSRHASREMAFLKINLINVIEILTEGFDCSRSKRKENIEERCLIKRKKIIKVVVAKTYDQFTDEKIWRIIHVGTFSIRK